MSEISIVKYLMLARKSKSAGGQGAVSHCVGSNVLSSHHSGHHQAEVEVLVMSRKKKSNKEEQ